MDLTKLILEASESEPKFTAKHQEQSKKILDYFNGKIDWAKMKDAWDELFNLDLATVTGFKDNQNFNPGIQLRELRDEKLKKYINKGTDGTSVPIVVNAMLMKFKDLPDFKGIRDEALAEATANFTEKLTQMIIAPVVWESRSNGGLKSSSKADVHIGATFLKGAKKGENTALNSTDGYLCKAVKQSVITILDKFGLMSRERNRDREFTDNMHSPERDVKGDFTNIEVKGSEKFLTQADLDLVLDDGFKKLDQIIRSSMSGQVRLIHELYYFEGFEIDEIKKILGVGSVGSILEKNNDLVLGTIKDYYRSK